MEFTGLQNAGRGAGWEGEAVGDIEVWNLSGYQCEREGTDSLQRCEQGGREAATLEKPPRDEAQ